MIKKLLLFGAPLVIIIAAVFLFMNNANKTTVSDDASKISSPEPTVTQISPTSTTKTFSLDDVKKHATKDDCWMVIDGKVYDATDFIPRHPGGATIAKGCGMDASTLFNERPDTDLGGHPEQALEQLEKLYIGDFVK